MSKNDKDSRELAPWQAFSELSRWEREMERLFENFFARRMAAPATGSLSPLFGSNLPALDLYEDNSELVAKVELPGLDKDDIDISISDHTLTVRAEKKQEEEIKRENYYRVERSRGAMRRTIDLPTDVEADQVKASYKDGVLEIRMPRSQTEQEKQKRIQIQ
jgi:HSP20 family protein